MDHTYYFYEGLCNMELGNYVLAEANLKQDIFIQTGGDNNRLIHFNTLLYTGILYYLMGSNDKATAYLQQCLSQYPQLPEANYYLAMVFKREKNNPLQQKYLQLARQAAIQGYGLNEDNISYTNYPRQVKLYEIEEELLQAPQQSP